jgi:transposase InsO family protein
VLARYGCPPLAHLDRGSGAAVRRYERTRPGELVHAGVKKLGNIPDGGGWRVTGVAQGLKNKRATTSLRHGKTSHPVIGYSCLHTAIDDHSRLACTEILADERKETAAAFLARAHAWYAAAGITIERVISDNGACYRSRDWAAACAALGIVPKRTRPYRPQTNGKVERYHRTLADEWAYAQPYATETDAAPPWTPGCTCATFTADTPRSKVSHRPAASPTCQGRTPSRRYFPCLCTARWSDSCPRRLRWRLPDGGRATGRAPRPRLRRVSPPRWFVRCARQCSRW